MGSGEGQLAAHTWKRTGNASVSRPSHHVCKQALLDALAREWNPVSSMQRVALQCNIPLQKLPLQG